MQENVKMERLSGNHLTFINYWFFEFVRLSDSKKFVVNSFTHAGAFHETRGPRLKENV